jgi:cell pole-organizing protein PopZ
MTVSQREDEGEMSIEEILSSIRRYIGDDTQTSATSAKSQLGPSYTPSREDADKTAEALAATLSASNAGTDNTKPVTTAAASQPTSPVPENIIRLTNVYAVTPESNPTAATPENVGILSPQAQSAATQSFARLAEAAMHPTSFASKHNQTGLTLEQLIGEIAQPLIKQWLDQNLPRLVELTVTKEIERLARQFSRDT